jgi:hypothetical protein
MKHLLTATLCVLVLLVCSSIAYSQEIQVGTFNLSPSVEGYSLQKGSGERTVSLEVTYPKPFDVKPEVVLNVNMIDAAKEANLRLSMKATSISRDGFTIQVKTWEDSKIFSIGGTWIAVAQKK